MMLACTVLLRDLLEPFHKHLNFIEPCIQFTVEKESDEKETALPRHAAVQRGCMMGPLAHPCTCRKAMHTDQNLSFTSHHPMAHKVAVRGED